MKVSDHYTGGRGEKYTRQKQADPFGIGYEIDYEYFRPYLEKRDVVLDFGCGNGGILRLVSRTVSRADGLEVNPSSASLAREQNLIVFSALSEIPADIIYDVIISNHVLEHIRDVCTTLEQLREHLKPGGRLIVKLPIDDPRARRQNRWSREDSDHHLQTWTPRLFANVLFESGYNVNECRVITSAWHPRLFPLRRIGLGGCAFRLLAFFRRRRQLFAIAANPDAV
ncbi:MAG: class I SAM-dependent methyltransferase [Chthoniobacterales bacterium]|nr:class I SAM-dependent methyltransferase [Chthoniobacterales bacterium]